MRLGRNNKKALSLVQLSLSILVISALSVLALRYTVKVNKDLSKTVDSRKDDLKIELIKKKLEDDLKQAVHVNPRCGQTASPNCEDVRVNSGVYFFPESSRSDVEGVHREQLNHSESFIDGHQLSDESSDSLRIIQFAGDEAGVCRLVAFDGIQNPSNGGGNEDFLVHPLDDPNCNVEDPYSFIQPGRLYMMSQGFSAASGRVVSYSSLFQITGISEFTFSNFQARGGVVDQNTPDPTFIQQSFRIGTNASISNVNQADGLGVFGFNANPTPASGNLGSARFTNVRIVDWTWSSEDGGSIYRAVRRSPNEAPYFKKMAKGVSKLQFAPSSTQVNYPRSLEAGWQSGDSSGADFVGVRALIELDEEHEIYLPIRNALHGLRNLRMANSGG